MNCSHFALTMVGVSAGLALAACTRTDKGSEVQFSSSAAPSILLTRLSKRGNAAFCYVIRDTTGPKSDLIFCEVENERGNGHPQMGERTARPTGMEVSGVIHCIFAHTKIILSPRWGNDFGEFFHG